MENPHSLSRHSVEEKSGIDAKFFQQGQLLNPWEDKNDNECNTVDIELEGINVSK